MTAVKTLAVDIHNSKPVVTTPTCLWGEGGGMKSIQYIYPLMATKIEDQKGRTISADTLLGVFWNLFILFILGNLQSGMNRLLRIFTARFFCEYFGQRIMHSPQYL